MREHHLFRLPSLEPRGAVLAEIVLDGVLLRVVGMHLDLSGLWRRQQAQAILAHLHERDGEPPTVLMGDLNEWSTRGGCLREFGADHDFAPCGRSLPRPPPDRLARPDHGQPRPRGGRQRRPPHRLLAPRLRPSADLGGAHRAGSL